MKNIFYLENIKSLRENYKTIADKIEEKKYDLDKNIEVLTETLENGEKIFKIKKDEKILYINGKYNPDFYIDKWLKEQKKIVNESAILVAGFGNGRQIKHLLKTTGGDTVILVYEPCVNIFLKSLEEMDLTEIFKSKKVFLVIEGVNENEIKLLLGRVIIFDTLKLLHHLILENYKELFEEKIIEYIKSQREYIKHVKFIYNTILRFSKIGNLNKLKNITYLYDNYSTYQLFNLLPAGIPVIVVAAGPSLNKNIKDLKAAHERACIIATDTALKPLLNEGIYPDFVAIVDGGKPGILFEHERLSEIPMVLTTVCSREPVQMHKGKKFFFWDGSVYETELIKVAQKKSSEKEKINISDLPTGGSVATSAFSFALQLGAKTIILIGQDLALTGNKTHADGTFKDKMEELDLEKTDLIEVEDVFGNPVKTRADLKKYLEWYNDKIPSLKEIKVIDATEGGAKITGTKIMTLKDAIEEECKNKVNIKNLLEGIKPIFHEPEVKVKVKQFFNETPERFLDLKKRVEKGIKYYSEMIKICEKKIFNQKEYLKYAQKVGNINNFIEEDGIALMVVDGMKEVDFSLRSNVYITEDNEKEERLVIVKHGKEYLEHMLKNIDALYQYSLETVGKVGN